MPTFDYNISRLTQRLMAQRKPRETSNIFGEYKISRRPGLDIDFYNPQWLKTAAKEMVKEARKKYLSDRQKKFYRRTMTGSGAAGAAFLGSSDILLPALNDRHKSVSTMARAYDLGIGKMKRRMMDAEQAVNSVNEVIAKKAREGSYGELPKLRRMAEHASDKALRWKGMSEKMEKSMLKDMKRVSKLWPHIKKNITLKRLGKMGLLGTVGGLAAYLGATEESELLRI